MGALERGWEAKVVCEKRRKASNQEAAASPPRIKPRKEGQTRTNRGSVQVLKKLALSGSFLLLASA